MSSLSERLHQTRQEISEECLRLGRAEPTLIVVTKNHSAELAKELYDLGERNFGENRVQEARLKSAELAEARPGGDLHWHLIGQLQTNKVRQALEFAKSIHSLDRIQLLEELAKRTEGRIEPLEVFLQVNLTEDENRGGLLPVQILGFAEKVLSIPTLNLKGLMAVASLDKAPEVDFEYMAKLSSALLADFPLATGLSIGMSNDFLTALRYGATHLRIGTAITGNRIF